MQLERNEFYIGEQRYLDFEVKTIRKEQFTIVDASYTVTNSKGVEVDKGSAEIDNMNNIVRFLFTAKEKGLHTVRLMVNVPPEVLKYKGMITVK